MNGETSNIQLHLFKFSYIPRKEVDIKQNSNIDNFKVIEYERALNNK